MHIFVLFGQRKERYTGEYAPECLAVMSEYDRDENPDYLVQEKLKADETDDFERTEIIAMHLSTDAVMAILRPNETTLAAKVL